MKKSILTLLIITLCFSAFSCARQNVTPESSAAKSTAQVEQNVGTEPFEELKISYTLCNYYTRSSLSELIEDAELIVIASTDTTFTDATPVMKDGNNQITNSINEVVMGYSYTPRSFKVHKVIKGDKSIKNVMVGESAIMYEQDGESRILALDGEYVTKAGTKYLMFLKPAVNTPDMYYPCHTQGKFNVDGNDKNSLKHVDNKMLNEIKKEYKNEFKETK
jgi:lipoprotein